MGKRIEPVFRGLAMLCLGCMGLTGIILAADPLRELRNLSVGTLAYYLISLLGGLALLLCIAMAIKSPWGKGALAGVAVALVLVINHVVGLRFRTILCSTPS